MTTYYVDSAGSNTSPYDTWAKAAVALQTVVSIPPAAADIIYARGTGTLAAEIDLASSGTNAGGWIKLIGCNAAGNVDGTRYILDGNAAGIHIFDFNTQDMWWLENIEVKNTGAGAKFGFYGSAAVTQGIVFINCCANTCNSNGWYLAQLQGAVLITCIAYSNTGSGFSTSAGSKMFFCCARDNTVDGFSAITTADVLVGCIAHGNGDDGFGGIDGGAVLLNCVSDGNTDDGIELLASTRLFSPLIIGCRITNHSGAGDNGLFLNGEPCIVGWSYFEDNTDNINDHTSVLFQFVPVEGGSTTTNLEDLANTNEGYAQAVANNNFATNYVNAGDPDLRRVKITIPWS